MTDVYVNYDSGAVRPYIEELAVTLGVYQFVIHIYSNQKEYNRA